MHPLESTVSSGLLRRVIGVAIGLRRLRWRHLSGALLALTICASEFWFRVSARRPTQTDPPPLEWGHGLSVIIPERGAPDMLRDCLTALTLALRSVDEPVEVIVVVNGSSEHDYRSLQVEFAEFRWLFAREALGFVGAILLGLGEARHGAVYLLNSDMLLEHNALTSAMTWRKSDVFAIASQIFFQEPNRRREETGWTSMVIENARPAPRHEIPVDDCVRGTVWAGAGSSLFNANLLRALLPGSLGFDPFYWEDVDFGVRAWRLGYAILFCPASIAWHKHRATVERYFDPTEVERIFERNRLQFQLRNPFPSQSLKATLARIARADSVTLRELGSWRSCSRIWRARMACFGAARRDLDYVTMWTKRYSTSQRPALVIVSPFCVLPPRQGGSVRTCHLAAALSKHFDVILVSDEGELYVDPDETWLQTFASVHLVRQRPREALTNASERIERIKSHSRQALRDKLQEIIRRYRPVVALLEHIETAGLIDVRAGGLPFILDLQDVLLSEDEQSYQDADRAEIALIEQFDGLLVGSAEDQALLGDRSSHLVPNGFDPRLPASYVPSHGKTGILFVGPFRAPNNWDGICDFLRYAYDQIERELPTVSLTIVGGKDAQRIAATHELFRRDSIRVLEFVEDIAPLYQACAITINPQRELRGSSLKVIESLAAGRVCVTTRTGARGMLDQNFSSLIATDGVEAFAPVLIQWLSDEAERLLREPPQAEKLAPYSWDVAGRALHEYVGKIIRSRQHLQRDISH